MVVETPLHISSGSYALTEDLGLRAKNVVRDLYKVTVNGQKLPAIPGSTLKGAARSVVEAVTHSCVGVTRERDLPRGVNRLPPADALPGLRYFWGDEPPGARQFWRRGG
ncbi:MAG: RAMP superfamily CRISPR-associated protein [Chloroflexi bacterium]|nr:RAMP superfamily CRISPR-associated protein [Chloroflexota bacterium]